MTLQKRVWYASFGSNLNRNRFMRYIDGGVAAGAKIPQPGCSDKTPPLKDAPIKIPHQL